MGCSDGAGRGAVAHTPSRQHIPISFFPLKPSLAAGQVFAQILPSLYASYSYSFKRGTKVSKSALPCRQQVYCTLLECYACGLSDQAGFDVLYGYFRYAAWPSSSRCIQPHKKRLPEEQLNRSIRPADVTDHRFQIDKT